MDLNRHTVLRNVLLSFLALCPYYGLVAQPSKVDSLKNVIASEKIDTIKVNQLNSLAYLLRYNEPLESKLYCQQALTLSRKLGFVRGEGISLSSLGMLAYVDNDWDSAVQYFQESMEAYSSLNDLTKQIEILGNLGNVYSDSGQPRRALEMSKQALDLSHRLGDSLVLAQNYFWIGTVYNSLGDNKKAFQYSTQSLEIYQKIDKKEKIWSVYNSLGIIHDDLGMYPEALEYYLTALSIVEELNDEFGKVVLTNNIGILYEITKDYPRALEYFEQALEVSVLLGSDQDQAGLHNNIALIYQNQSKYERALYHYRKALMLYDKLSDLCGLAYPLEGLGDLYTRIDSPDSAQLYFDKALSVALDCQDMVVTVTVYKSLGRLYEHKGDQKQAIVFFNKSLQMAQRMNYRNDIKENAYGLYENYKKLGKFRLALEYHELYKASQDSLFNKESTQLITKLGDEYSFEKERQQFEYDQEKKTLKYQAELGTQQLIRNAILIVLLLALVIVWTLGRSYYLIQRNNKKLRRLNEEKNTLIGVVAHDLRSPLNNIRAMMPLIKSEINLLSDHQKEFLDMINLSVERMGDMINRVLDINAIEARKINLKIEACDLSETLDMTVQNFAVSTEKKRVGVEKNFKLKRHFAHVDKNYLIQVIENILSNAIKFSNPDHNIYLDVESSGGKEQIRIRDEGPGISDQDQKKLFNKYQKLSAKPTANETSTGLGLSIAKKYIEAMQGKIWCESEIGKGATFIIEFDSIKSSVSP